MSVSVPIIVSTASVLSGTVGAVVWFRYKRAVLELVREFDQRHHDQPDKTIEFARVLAGASPATPPGLPLGALPATARRRRKDETKT